ncbi:Tyrosine recombinase XerC [Lysinibacillus sphaericus]|nr:Tyrosine recombinase XerC [Lysinibacillus sphaericus]
MGLEKGLYTSLTYYYDIPFQKLSDDFLRVYPTSRKNDLEQCIELFYVEFSKSVELLSKERRLRVEKVKLLHVLKIQEKVERLEENKTLDKSSAAFILNVLKMFCKYITKQNSANVYYVPPQSDHKYKRNNLQIHYPILLKFENYMNRRSYSDRTIHYYLINVRHFLKYSSFTSKVHHNNHYWKDKIERFEVHLNQRIVMEKIKTNTGYAYLKAVKLFTEFLNEQKLIDFHYSIPNNFIKHGKRTNEYVSSHDILKVIEKIFEVSKNVLRDLSIFLIILETGCRPIEVVNLNVNDIYLHEKLIVLKSKKSQQRTLTLVKDILPFIKDYLRIRENYNSANTEALFLSQNGMRMDSKTITQMFRKYNKHAFNDNRFTPKTLRHKFITDALNNDNNMNQVRQIVGHKHLVSTYYYVYRDIHNFKNQFGEIKLI